MAEVEMTAQETTTETAKAIKQTEQSVKMAAWRRRIDSLWLPSFLELWNKKPETKDIYCFILDLDEKRVVHSSYSDLPALFEIAAQAGLNFDDLSIVLHPTDIQVWILSKETDPNDPDYWKMQEAFMTYYPAVVDDWKRYIQEQPNHEGNVNPPVVDSAE